MSNPSQKVQAPVTPASPDQAQIASPEPTPVDEQSAHQGATEKDVVQTLPPTNDPTMATEDNNDTADEEIDPADEITPG